MRIAYDRFRQHALRSPHTLPHHRHVDTGAAAHDTGMYAYKSMFSIIMFFQKIDDATVGTAYLDSALRNGMITVFVILMLAAGATLPILMMPSKAYTMTRRRVYPSQQNND